MANDLQLRLLGSCDIEYNGAKLQFESGKVRALFVYLVMNPHSHQRDKIMGLFWRDFPEAKARRNLRHAIWNLRKQINLPASPSFLTVDSQRISVLPETDIWLDVAEFQDVVMRSVDPSERPTLDKLAAALEHYRGDFLEGFHVRGAQPFDEWALVERERLRILALTALQQLTTGYAALQETELACSYARRWLSLAPWQEAAHQQVMRLLAVTGQREAALRQYETCCQTLAAELGVSPSPETTQLYEQIKTESSRIKSSTTDFNLKPANLPIPPTPFIGRENEIAEVAELLANPDCRLLTITGPGGMGKTRLGLQIITQENVQSRLGVVFVPLVDLNSPAEIIPAMITALDCTLFGPQEPRRQLIDFLQGKHILFMLDNFEHLAAGATVILGILEAVSSVKILVTSRARLNLQGEWVYPLEGLPESLASQLFIQTAQRLFLGRSFTAETAPVNQICEMLAGLPLAVELTAAWVRILTYQEIIAELEAQASPTFLRTQMQDVPARHRSMLMVFEHSWNLLPARAQQILMSLSVFRGGFCREAAEAVTGATLSDLAVLVDKSLLRRRLDGRYDFHGLIRGFAIEKLNQSGHENKIRDSHAQYFSYLIATRAEPPRALLLQVDREIKNLRAAWRWAVAQKDWNLIEQLRDKLYIYFEVNSAFSEGTAYFNDAFVRLTGITDPLELKAIDENLISWKIIASWAALKCRLGQLNEAGEMFTRCIDVFRHHAVQKELAFSLFYLGDTTRIQGNLDLAGAYLQESLTIYRKLDMPVETAFARNVLGLVAAAKGDPDQAKKLLEESRVSFQNVDHPWGLAIVNINLGSLLKTLQEYEAATITLEEGLALCQQLGHRWAAAVCYSHLGELALLQNNPTCAQAHYLKSLTLHQEINFSPGVQIASAKLVDVLLEQGNNEQALALMLKLGGPPEKISALKETLSADQIRTAVSNSSNLSIEEIAADVKS